MSWSFRRSESITALRISCAGNSIDRPVDFLSIEKKGDVID